MDLRELQQSYLEETRRVTAERLLPGALIRAVISADEGLVFKDGRTCKPKLIVIVGVDLVNEICYGSVLVNTNMSPKSSFSPQYLEVQYLLRQEDYPDFLKYDSFVDCGMLFSIPFGKLASGEYFGVLTKSDFDGIFDILETTDVLTTKEKKRYGIRRR
mgnify:CR=1 FL=1